MKVTVHSIHACGHYGMVDGVEQTKKGAAAAYAEHFKGKCPGCVAKTMARRVRK